MAGGVFQPAGYRGPGGSWWVLAVLGWLTGLVLVGHARAADGHGSHGAGPQPGAGVAPKQGSAHQPVGATVEELIALALKSNPEVAAAALEADAAEAAAQGAGSLRDPKLVVEFKDIARATPGYEPSRIGTTIYGVRQELPFWGKRGLRREIALAASREASWDRETAVAELVARVKVIYFQYHQAHLEGDENRALMPVLDSLVQAAQLRYGQGMAQQGEVVGAELQRAAVESELARIDADRRKARFRLNALLRRPADAPLVEQPHPRPLPPPGRLDPEGLAARAKAHNPGLQALRARLQGADQRVRLAERNWYPDAEVGVGVMEKYGVVSGYEAMVAVNLPLQWEAKRADEREAAGRAGAARERLAAREHQVEAAVHEAYWNLETARRQEGIVLGSALPQARIGLESALRKYEVGQGEFAGVLEGIQRLRATQVERLRLQAEQQASLAELEQLVGGDL